MIKNISGIQQIGVGVTNVYEAWKFYRLAFGADIPVLDDNSVARLMLPYTGGQPQERHAVLAINIQGGGGFEIWQYTGRTPAFPSFSILPGDLGINIAKVKCSNADDAFRVFAGKGIRTNDKVYSDDPGRAFFYCTDPWGNIFQVIEDTYCFKNTGFPTGGIIGAIIGVSDAERSLRFYSGVLGYDQVLYDKTGCFEDLDYPANGKNSYRRVLLKHTEERKGTFSRLFGPSQIELIQVLDREPRQIFKDRYWGDPGFIHLCFDVYDMPAVINYCNNNGHKVTVDSSADFEMGEAAGHFVYIEDPDGTLIEFVETFKIPVIKKIGWFLSLKKRDHEKPLPDWMLKALSFNRVK